MNQICTNMSYMYITPLHNNTHKNLKISIKSVIQTFDEDVCLNKSKNPNHVSIRFCFPK